MNRLLCILIGLLAAAPLAAQDFSGLPEPLVTDRPDFTESTSTVPLGHYQLEGGYTFSRQGEEDSHSFGELLLRVGAGERWEARFGIGSYDRIEPSVRGATKLSGYEDPTLGVKIRLTEDDPNLLPPGWPRMAMLLSTTIPIGSDELTADDWQPDGKLALAWDLSDRLSLSSNLIYAYPSDGGERFNQFAASLSAGLALSDRLGVYLETFGFSKESADGSSTSYVNSGLTWLLSNDLQIDARIGAGLDEPRPNWFAGAGAGIRF
jgi:Putative MetA-pathway of phenol degradation